MTFRLRPVLTIAKRDLKSYFTSPMAYVIMSGFLFIMGFMFFSTLEYFNSSNMQAQQFGGKSMSLTDGIIRPLYGNMNVILLFICPAITMRLFAEERKNQTIQILMTAPITLDEMIVGKFLSAVFFVGTLMLATLVYPAILFFVGNPEIGPLFTCLLGTMLLASSLISMGVFFSATTESQIVAMILTLVTTLFFWLISWASYSAGPVWSDVLGHLSLINHFNNFGQGMIHSSDVIFFLSFIFLGLFLTHRVLDSYRWR